MFNLLNIQKRQSNGGTNYEDEKGINKNFQQSPKEKFLSSFKQQLQTAYLPVNFQANSQTQYENNNIYFRSSTSHSNRQNGMLKQIPMSAQGNSRSSHQIQRLASALRVPSGHTINGINQQEFDQTHLPHSSDQMSVLNNQFPNFPNKFKKERIASAVMSQKYIKKLGPRPETSKINQTQQMQQKYMDMFNQPKNLLNQVISIQETQNQSKKFFTESRVKTASTRSQTYKEIESLADIKDFKQIMQDNFQKKQQEGKNHITFATIDRAKTANELQRKTSQNKANFKNQELENIDDESENPSKRSEQVSYNLPPRAETAQIGSVSSNTLLKEVNRLNNDVHSHLKKHMNLKNQNAQGSTTTLQERPQTNVVGQRQPVSNNFFGDLKPQEELSTQQEQIYKIDQQQQNNQLGHQNIATNQKPQQDFVIGQEQELITKRKNVQINLDSMVKEKLKIDLNKSSQNPPSSALKSPSTFNNTPKSFKGVQQTPKNSKTLRKKSARNQNNKNDPQSLNQLNQQDFENAQREEIVFRLNLKSKALTQAELNYIIKNRRQYQQDLQPYMEILQKQFDENHTDIFGSKKQMTFSVLDVPTIVNLENPISNSEQNLLNKDVVINQQNIVEQEKFFFDHPNNIHDQLKDYGEELRQKFEKYHLEDQLDFQRFQQKKEQFVYNFLNTNEEGVSQHELNLVMEEYKLPTNERDYEFLDTIAERLKFFKRFTKPTRMYLLKLANIVQYPADQIIFNQGDEGDLMYVIIRGACHVRIKRISPDGKDDSLVVATLYDGQQFGELALMNQKKSTNIVKSIKANDLGPIRISQIKKELEKQPLFNKVEQDQDKEESKHKDYKKSKQKNQKKQKSEEDLNKMLEEANKSSSKRAATIETCEVTTLFTVSRDYFKTILLGLIQKELDVKLKLLQTLSFFEYMDPVSLIPLANLVEVKKFKLGEILVREGQEPNNLFIVSSGRLKIIKEEIIVRNNFVMGRERKFSNKKLNFGIKDYTKIIPEGTVKKNTLVDNTKVSQDQESDYEDFDNDAPLKAANYEIIFTDDQNIAYKYQHEFGSLVRGDFFFGRAILLEYLKVDPAAEDEYQTDPRERAKLTVIADSAEIEVYILEKDKIHLIPNILRRTMIDGLITRKEYDAIYTTQVSKWSKQWDKYKSNVLEQIKVERIYKNSLK
ncbi:hypothetical protein ABPG72_019632 [Tetrahymena utriculariae]